MIEHKAYLFDSDRFDRELRPIIEAALATNDPGPLTAFIESNTSDLKDPYEGEPLPEDWAVRFGSPDVQLYGDIALTKYYGPASDIGLGAAWEGLQELFGRDRTLRESPILGSPIGSPGGRFDPGKMGAYFQSPVEVNRNCRYLSRVLADTARSDVRQAVEMLCTAAQAGKGLYVTF